MIRSIVRIVFLYLKILVIDIAELFLMVDDLLDVPVYKWLAERKGKK